MAFDVVEQTAKRWPAPATIYEALPTYEHTYTPEPMAREARIEVDPEYSDRAAERARAAIAECAEKLNVDLSKP